MDRKGWKNRLNLCCDEEMYQKIKQMAQEQQRSISSLVRMLIAEALHGMEFSGEQI